MKPQPGRLSQKAVLLLAGLFACWPARAEWPELGDTESGTLYFEPLTMKVAGPNVKVWVLNDFRAARPYHGGRDVRSLKQLLELDCSVPQWRSRFALLHADAMGRDAVVQSGKPDPDWDPVPPHTMIAPVVAVVAQECVVNSGSCA